MQIARIPRTYVVQYTWLKTKRCQTVLNRGGSRNFRTLVKFFRSCCHPGGAFTFCLRGLQHYKLFVVRPTADAIVLSRSLRIIQAYLRYVTTRIIAPCACNPLKMSNRYFARQLEYGLYVSWTGKGSMISRMAFLKRFLTYEN